MGRARVMSRQSPSTVRDLPRGLWYPFTPPKLHRRETLAPVSFSGVVGGWGRREMPRTPVRAGSVRRADPERLGVRPGQKAGVFRSRTGLWRASSSCSTQTAGPCTRPSTRPTGAPRPKRLSNPRRYRRRGSRTTSTPARSPPDTPESRAGGPRLSRKGHGTKGPLGSLGRPEASPRLRRDTRGGSTRVPAPARGHPPTCLGHAGAAEAENHCPRRDPPWSPGGTPDTNQELTLRGGTPPRPPWFPMHARNAKGVEETDPAG